MGDFFLFFGDLEVFGIRERVGEYRRRVVGFFFSISVGEEIIRFRVYKFWSVVVLSYLAVCWFFCWVIKGVMFRMRSMFYGVFFFLSIRVFFF